MPVDIPAFIYAAAVTGGGILGYIKSSSLPSLGAGLLFGSFLGYGAFQVSNDPHNYGTLAGTSAGLGALMGYRYYKTGKIIPGGIAAMSAFMVIRILYRHFTLPQKTMDIKQ